MKLQCPKSGVRYTIDCGYGTGRVDHPIFKLPAKSLLEFSLSAYIAGSLKPDDLHLLGCALVNQLPLDAWNATVTVTESLWPTVIKQLATTVARMDGRELEYVPKFRIDRQNADLSNLDSYLEAVNIAIDTARFDPTESRRALNSKNSQSELTEKLFKILRDGEQKLRERHKLPQLIAQWAATAGNFPREKVTFGNNRISLRDYWRQLIIIAFSKDSVNQLIGSIVTKGDYAELIEHCEQSIPYGSLHTDTLLNTLRGAVDILKEFKPNSRDVNARDILEDGAELAPVVPVEKPSSSAPVRSAFASSLDYIKARSRWAVSVTQYSSYVSSAGSKAGDL